MGQSSSSRTTTQVPGPIDCGVAAELPLKVSLPGQPRSSVNLYSTLCQSALRCSNSLEFQDHKVGRFTLGWGDNKFALPKFVLYKPTRPTDPNAVHPADNEYDVDLEVGDC